MRSRSFQYYLAVLVVQYLFVATAHAGEAATDSAFTYQGQLKVDGVPINTTCNMRFKLRTDPIATDETGVVGTLVFDGSNPQRPPVVVSKGLFHVVLDFPLSALVQRPVWLDVSVQCPSIVDREYDSMMPRQEITTVPFSAQTRGISVDDFGRVGINTTPSSSRLTIEGPESSGSSAVLRIQSGSDFLLIDGNEIDSTGTLQLNFNSSSPVAVAVGGGSVGIGTTDVSRGRLSIQQAQDTSDGGITVVNSSAQRAVRLWVDANNVSHLDSGVGGTQPLVLNAEAGAVGIGTNSPIARLTLSRPTQSASHQLELRNEGSIQRPNFDGIVFTQGINGDTELGSIKLMYRNTGKPDLSFGVRDRPDALYIHGNESGRGGNVGIGTTTPNSRLEVVGDSDPTMSLRAKSLSGKDAGLSIRGARNGTTSADIAYIDLRNFDDNEGDGTDYAMARIAGGMADASGQTGYLRFKTNDGTGLKEQLRIDKQGNVGLGTDTPTERLDVNGNIKVEGIILLSTRPGRVSISPYAFQNLLNTRFGNLGTFTKFPAVMSDVVSESFYAAANVQLPRSARLVGLTARIRDDADPGDLRITFWKTVYDDFNGIHFTSPIAEVDSTGAPGEDTISVAIVPSQAVSPSALYYVSFESIGETLPDVAVSLFNVTIEYEISILRP